MPKKEKKKECAEPISAAMEIISEAACGDGEYKNIDVGDGMLAWIPKKKMEEMGIDPNNPNPDREEAIKKLHEGEMG